MTVLATYTTSGFFGIDLRNRQIAAADTARRPRIGRNLRPAFAGIVGSIHPDRSRCRANGCVEPARIAGRNRNMNLREILRQSFRQRMPCVAIVGGLEQPAAGAIELVVVLPRPFARFPQGCVDNVRVGGIDRYVGAAGALILRDDSLPRPAAIGRTINPSLIIGPIRMPEHGCENTVGIAGIYGKRGNLLRIIKAEMGPGLAGIDGFVNAVANGEIGANQPFAAADVDDIRVGRGNCDRANGLRGFDRRRLDSTCGRSRRSSILRR